MRTHLLCAALFVVAGCSKKDAKDKVEDKAAAADATPVVKTPVADASVAVAAPDAAPVAPAVDAAPALPEGVVELELKRGYSSAAFDAESVGVRFKPPAGWKKSDTFDNQWDPEPAVHPTSLSVYISLDHQDRALAADLIAAAIESQRDQESSSAKLRDEVIADLPNGGKAVTWVIDAKKTRSIIHGQTMCFYAQDGGEWIVGIRGTFPEGDSATADIIRAACETLELRGATLTEAERKPAIVIANADNSIASLAPDTFEVVVERLPFWTSIRVKAPLDVNGIRVTPNRTVVKDGDGLLQEFTMMSPHDFPTPLDGVVVTCAAGELVQLDDGKLTSCLLDAPVTIGKAEYPRWTELKFFNGKAEPPEKKAKKKKR